MKNQKIIIGALLIGGIAYFLLKKKKGSASTDATQRMATSDEGAGSEESAESEESGAMGGGGGGGAIGGGAMDGGAVSSNTAILGSGNVLVANSGVGVGRPMNPNLPSYKPKPNFNPIIKPTFNKPTFSTIPSYKPKPTGVTSPITFPKVVAPKLQTKGVLAKTNFLTFDGSYRQSASHFFDGNID